jgi:hypothetical protein
MQSLEQSFGSKSYDIVKASLISREILLEEVKKISNAIGYTLEDLDHTDLTLGKYETIQPSKSGSPSYNNGQGASTKCSPQMTGILRDFLEVYFSFFQKKVFYFLEYLYWLMHISQLVSEFWCCGWKH